MEKVSNVEPKVSLTIEVRDKDGNLKHHEVVEGKATEALPPLEDLVTPWKRP